jgi:hypothetical protein
MYVLRSNKVAHDPGDVRIVVSVTDDQGAGITGLDERNFQIDSYVCANLGCHFESTRVVGVTAHELPGTYAVFVQSPALELPGDYLLAIRVSKMLPVGLPAGQPMQIVSQGQLLLSFLHS